VPKQLCDLGRNREQRQLEQLGTISWLGEALIIKFPKVKYAQYIGAFIYREDHNNLVRKK
jgi:hypothetical protein